MKVKIGWEFTDGLIAWLRLEYGSWTWRVEDAHAFQLSEVPAVIEDAENDLVSLSPDLPSELNTWIIKEVAK